MRRELANPAVLPENVYNMDKIGVLLSIPNSLKVLVSNLPLPVSAEAKTFPTGTALLAARTEPAVFLRHTRTSHSKNSKCTITLDGKEPISNKKIKDKITIEREFVPRRYEYKIVNSTLVPDVNELGEYIFVIRLRSRNKRHLERDSERHQKSELRC
ncbi:hypothetical protein TSTA_068150 [Talaromyces stipitatus ATCC 10500]|uniref:Uncharacterized protein n=1 Tax=Talaromyces stipitatus (strain ATCC 10500 / CBS 375.48 / QM 6759 / NRRL 1006) TaxID=441959 RepID=B8LYN0_TALSN|nr:uncharacterized protein TSTA_068150 [Talaromyces stipitatus ATCC 10500]EED23388.1 hypothetical protein TSTA_068150 [Talaromyces stipitatus ATCC 10500]